ncbi:MAG: hypothetical protein QOF76_3667 [Solirubrobacteraceae bacterium]|nr:hypothetical protein [Solirubrobacteraceae bacterium]
MLGITRMNCIALTARDPAAAAAFAERCGFTAVHAKGAHYLKGHGPDPYCLQYVPGDGPGMSHASYLVTDLGAAAAHLDERGIAYERGDWDWESPDALRFSTPAGHTVQLTTGVHLDAPLGHAADTPGAGAAPLGPDHVAYGAVNFEIEEAFFQHGLGFLHSSRIVGDNGPQIMSFMRVPDRWLYHQAVVVRGGNELHHLQFTLKNADSFWSTYEALQSAGVNVEWGPLRHGPGHNIALYFRDPEGHFIEYSVEEETILDDATYVPRWWSTADPKVVDEWGTGPPPPADKMGPPADKLPLYGKLGGRMAQMLKKKLYVCISRGGAPHPSPGIETILEHLEWAIEQEKAGRIFAMGPFKTELNSMQGDGLLIIRADSLEEAKAIFMQDPIHRDGYRTPEVYGWELHQGTINVSVDLSTQEYRFV